MLYEVITHRSDMGDRSCNVMPVPVVVFFPIAVNTLVIRDVKFNIYALSQCDAVDLKCDKAVGKRDIIRCICGSCLHAKSALSVVPGIAQNKPSSGALQRAHRRLKIISRSITVTVTESAAQRVGNTLLYGVVYPVAVGIDGYGNRSAA